MPSFRLPSRSREPSRSRDQSRDQSTQRSQSRNPFRSRSQRPSSRRESRPPPTARFEHLKTKGNKRLSVEKYHSEAVLQTWAAAQNVEAAAQRMSNYETGSQTFLAAQELEVAARQLADHESGKRRMRYSMQRRVTESAMAAAAGAQHLAECYEDRKTSVPQAAVECPREKVQEVCELVKEEVYELDKDEVCELEGDYRYSQYMDVQSEYRAPEEEKEKQEDDYFRNVNEVGHGYAKGYNEFIPAEKVTSPAADSGYASDERTPNRDSTGSNVSGYMGAFGGAVKDVGETLGNAGYLTVAGLGRTGYNMSAGLGAAFIGQAR